LAQALRENGFRTTLKANDQIWLFTVYDKDEADDLTSDQRKVLKARLEQQIKAGSLK
jgi:organic radical activating enzyme